MNKITASRAYGMGHNGGPELTEVTVTLKDMLDPAVLRDQYTMEHADKTSRRDALLASVKNVLEKHGKTGIPDDEVAGNVSALLKMLSETASAVDKAREAIGEPFLSATRVVNAFFLTGIVKPLREACETRSPLNRLQAAYLQAKADAEKARLDEEQRLARERADAIAQQALARAGATLRDATAADDVAQQAEIAANAAPSALGRVASTYGTTSSLGQIWTFQVEDIALVPREWLKLDEEKVRLAIRRKDKPVRDIPGIKIWADAVARTR
jgi:hypothetical protein